MMYDWFPIVFFAFKVVVLGTGMFFAIKWHYDQDKKKKNETSGRENKKIKETSGP